MSRKYSWIPDLPDARDQVFRVAAPVALPPLVDMRKQCPPIEDQGELGSCTANAIAGAIEFIALKGKKYVGPLSRLFIYWQERRIEGTLSSDAGAQIRDGIKACAKLGAPVERLWPYIVSRYKTAPSKAAYTDALNHKITGYRRVLGLAELRTSIAAGFPVAFGFSVYESFESDLVAQTGDVPMPGPNERMLGGHAVLAIGYDDAHQRIIVRNSWGNGWGQAGYFTLPYSYVQRRDLSDDFWQVNL